MEIITDFSSVERLLLPETCCFSEDARNVINCWESKEILACPGSGKTTVLIAKLKLLADRLPLESGRGVCVLSHTNVAVNELKAKLGQAADNLLSYPNFVGTIQTFVDQYITFPYLKRYTSVPLQVVSNEDYAKHLYEFICKTDGRLKWFINQQYKTQGSNRFDSVENFLSNVYLDDQNNLRIINGKHPLAGAQTNTATNYRVAIHNLLEAQGLMTYADTYQYTLKALDYYGEALHSLLSSRFKYVFVDEYQDCSKLQRTVLDVLFTDVNTVFQKIGDIDQAIYNNTDSKSVAWQASGEHLSIANSNRYSQDIADVLTLLRTEKTHIHSERGSQGIKPTLFIFDEHSRLAVIPAFIAEIQRHALVRPDGIYKAIGMYKNVSGLKIADYWKDYRNDVVQKTSNCFPDYVSQIISSLSKGQLYLCEKCIRKLICKVLHYNRIKVGEGKEYGIKTIKQYIASNCSQEYQDAILNFANLQDFSYSTVDEKIKALLNVVCGHNWFESMPDAFMRSSQDEHIQRREHDNIYHDDSNVSIIFDTVHGVKGETHDATLYLETETKNSSDIKRILPLLENKITKNQTDLHERSRKCVYVGFSRPKHLLCLAINKNTYVDHESAFSMWNVIDLRADNAVFE